MLRRGGSVLVRWSVAARTHGSDSSPGRWDDANVARFRAKEATVIDRVAGLILPLMHHLVQQRVQRFLPAVSSDVTATHDDLGRFAGRRRRHVVAQSRTHAS